MHAARATAAVVVLVALSMLAASGTHASSAARGATNLEWKISACIDGRSTLTLTGATARWTHYDWREPGLHSACGANKATVINGASWTPRWSPCSGATSCSDQWGSLKPAVPSDFEAYDLEKVSGKCRLSCTVKVNAQDEILVFFDDNAQSGPTAYEITVRLSLDEPVSPTTTTTTRPTCDPAKAIGHLKALHGDVSYRGTSGDWRDAARDEPFCLGDEVHTGAESDVVLVFRTGSYVKLRALTQIAVDSLAGDKSRAKIQVLLISGAIVAKANKPAGVNADFSVKTPTATAAVRGTVFSVAYDPGTRLTTVVTTQGVVEVDPAAKGATVMVKAGQAVDVKPAGAVAVAKTKIAARDRARSIVVEKVAEVETACKLTIPLAANVVSVAAAGASWKVTVRTTKGVSLWSVTGSKVAPANALAKKIAGRCTAAGLASGTYRAVTVVGGKTYVGRWVLTVTGAQITGQSYWDCCPGPRTDPLSGTVRGTTVTITRACGGNGAPADCRQIHTGTIGAAGAVAGKITGSFTGPGDTFTLSRTG